MYKLFIRLLSHEDGFTVALLGMLAAIVAVTLVI